MAADTHGVALVTGASRGIGRRIAEDLLAAGYTVVAMSREAPGFAHARLHAIEVDLGDASAARQAAAEACARFSPTTLVHNAGAMRPALLPDATAEDLHALTDLHLASPMAITQAALPTMRAAGFGRIVFVSSRAALGLATRTAYSATKAGVHGMARTWALELGPDGITVNVVAPGPVVTDIFHEVVPREDQARIDRIAQGLPMRRLGRVEDVSRAVLFFASPDNGWVTGQVLYVCGGASIGGVTF